MRKTIKHPSYDLYLRTASCKYELYINDVLLYIVKPGDGSLGTGTGTDVPLNSTILKNGKHEFLLKIFPWINKQVVDEDAYAELILSVADTDKIYLPKENRPEDIELLRMETPWGGLDEGIHYPFYELKGEFTVDMLPFELVGWSKSVYLGDEDEKKLFQEVFAFYQQLHALMKERNAVKFEALQEEKEQLISKAFYYDYHVDIKKEPMYIAMVEDRKNAFSGLFAEEGLELVPLNPAELKLLIQAHGKLVSLVRHDNTPALRFNDPKNGGEVEMEIRLHRKVPGTPLSII